MIILNLNFSNASKYNLGNQLIKYHSSFHIKYLSCCSGQYLLEYDVSINPFLNFQMDYSGIFPWNGIIVIGLLTVTGTQVVIYYDYK